MASSVSLLRRVLFGSAICSGALIACSSQSNPSGGTGGTPSSGGSTSSGGALSGGLPSSTGGTAGAAVSSGGMSASGGMSGASGASGTSGASGSSGGGASGASGAGGSSSGAGGLNSSGSSAGGASGSAGAGAAGSAGAPTGGSSGAGAFTLSSPAWKSESGCGPDNKAACGIFPKDNTALNGGKNQSPELNWTPGPSGTQSYAIVLHDLTNVTMGKAFVHWVMWNIPGTVNQLPANLDKAAMPSFPPGSSQRSLMNNGYYGSGKCGNVYEFVLYALPMATFTPSSATNQTQVANALEATNAPTATLRGRSGAPECME